MSDIILGIVKPIALKYVNASLHNKILSVNFISIVQDLVIDFLQNITARLVRTVY